MTEPTLQEQSDYLAEHLLGWHKYFGLDGAFEGWCVRHKDGVHELGANWQPTLACTIEALFIAPLGATKYRFHMGERDLTVNDIEAYAFLRNNLSHIIRILTNK